MIRFIVVAAAFFSVPAVAGEGTATARTAVSAISRYDACLIREATRIARRESSRTARYRRYATACTRERAEFVDEFIRSQTSGDLPDLASRRWTLFERANARADTRAGIWAGRVLDPGPVQY